MRVQGESDLLDAGPGGIREISGDQRSHAPKIGGEGRACTWCTLPDGRIMPLKSGGNPVSDCSPTLVAPAAFVGWA